MNIQIKNTLGKVLFEYDIENNSVKKTLEEAVRRDINLEHANLIGADLEGANLSKARLSFAHLSKANLQHAILVHADLKGVDLWCANLKGANLSCANLYTAISNNCNFQGVKLGYTDFRFTTLRYSDFSNVNFYNSYFNEADINNVKFTNEPPIPLACPSEGSFIGWKKISNYKENYDGEYVVKLLIPEDAKRSSATSNKCRCNKAKVLEITNIDNGSNVDIITNSLWTNCVYKVGEIVYPDSFDEDRWNECSNGIHFFIDKQEAINYY